ncbi:DAK2 domain-containing protein [Galactobacter valiniphilus]|uniref:DAK2 domain-containing protein n=1 Tax=Galactobacter valiniphilus TaxID=2676122 RepID=A0A399J948_9MICC|nr:DAK2 domain-containing protein [Galactobacter valiniphilus]RII41754.1 DAK2 domain-containing protein [Galactobacter valiniphilus]
MTPRHRTGYAAVRSWLSTAVQELANHSDRLNAINVFPVADGDTGSNLYRTARAALDEVEARPDAEDLGALLGVAGRAGLEGAHGNSGTLLAVMLVGMGEALRGERNLTAANLAEALETARVRAWSALSEPVPGTMLSVLEAAALTARSVLLHAGEEQGRALLAHSLEAVRAACLQAVRDTSTQLDALSRAHVVDAGAVGLCLVLDALDCAVTARVFTDDDYEPLQGYGIGAPDVTRSAAQEEGVEVMCTVTATPLQAATLRAGLDAVGTSVLMSPVSPVGEAFRWRVHVHVAQAELALDAVARVGPADEVAVTSLCTQAHD